MAEAKFNSELRVDRMIATATNTVTCRCSTLPDDWLEFEFVSIQNPNGANGWLPLYYKPRAEFFNLADHWAYGYYTIEGRVITFGGAPDAIEGIPYQIAYYGEVPVFSDTQESWVYDKYGSLYLYAALINADLHAVGEEQLAANMKQLAEDMIQKLNVDHLRARASGARLKRSRIRSFG